MVTKGYLIRGAYHYDDERYHRNKESFEPSHYSDFTGYREGDGVRIIRELNGDILGTNDYNIVIITRETAIQCDEEMAGQWSDGIFENCNVESPTELGAEETQKYIDMFNLYNHNRFVDVSNCYKMMNRLDDLKELSTSLSSELIINIGKEYGEYYRGQLSTLLQDASNILYNICEVATRQRDETNYISQRSV